VTNWTEAIGRPLRALHLDSLKKQVLVLAAAAAFLPALAMLVVAARRNRGSLDQEIAPVLRGASAEASWRIDRWLAERLDDLRVVATSYAVTDNLPRLQGRGAAEALGRLKDYLNSARERSSDCEALVLLDPHGKVVTASGGRMSGVQFSLDRVNGLRTGDLLVGDAYWDTGIARRQSRSPSRSASPTGGSRARSRRSSTCAPWATCCSRPRPTAAATPTS